MPDISIIMPVFNGEKYIERAIDSILGQSYENFELLVVDDGSTDNTARIISRMKISDKRINYIYQENKGVSSARNKGLDNAAGKYIAFLDYDDEYYTAFLQKTKNGIEKNNADYCVCHARIDTGGKTEIYRPKRTKNEIIDSILFRTKIRINGILTNKEFLLNNGIVFDESKRCGEDHDFIYKVVSIGRSAYVGEILCSYNFVENSLSNREHKRLNASVPDTPAASGFLEWAAARKPILKSSFASIGKATDTLDGKRGIREYWRNVLNECKISENKKEYLRKRIRLHRITFTKSGIIYGMLRMMILLPFSVKRILAPLFKKAGLLGY